MASAASGLMTSTRAHARARATSKSSIPLSHASSLTAAAAWPREKTPAKSPSDVKEDGLGWPLEVDVKTVTAVDGRSEEGCPSIWRHLRWDGALIEVDAGDDPVQEPPRKHGHVDERRIGGRLQSPDRPVAVVVGRGTCESAEAVVNRRVDLPRLDHRVGHRDARAVEDRAGDLDCAISR